MQLLSPNDPLWALFEIIGYPFGIEMSYNMTAHKSPLRKVGLWLVDKTTESCPLQIIKQII